MNNTLIADVFVDRLSNALSSTGFGLDNIPELVLIVINEGYWKERVLEQTGQVVRFDRFVDFVTSPPLEGLGAKIETLKQICKGTEAHDALEAIDAVTRGTPGKRPNVEVYEQIRQYKEEHPEASNREVARAVGVDRQVVSDASGGYNPYNIRDKTANTPDYGTSLSYTLRRLKSEYPELYQRVVAGDLSANAAAREAGIRRPTTTIYTDDVASIARTLRKKLDADTLAELIDLLQCGTLPS